MAERLALGDPVPPRPEAMVYAGWNPRCGHVRQMATDRGLDALELSPALVYGLLPKAEATERLIDCPTCRPPAQSKLWGGGSRMSSRAVLEQEPITNFRRDVVAEDEFRIRVETVVAELLHEERVTLAWSVRRILGLTCIPARPVFRGFDVILQARELLR